MNKSVVIGILLVIGLAAGYALWGRNSAILTNTPVIPSDSMMEENIDQHFIVQMIPHHEGAIAMAKIALERSKRPEMLSLARGIIESQEKEIADIRGWHQSWYGVAVPNTGGTGMHMSRMTGEPEVLASISSSDFDREFIEQMIPHHEMAVMMAQMLASSTKYPEMQQLAQDIITSQSSEIEMMRGWLKSWYGIQ